MTLEHNIGNLIEQLADILTAQDLMFARELLDAHEYGEALYVIVTQLYEYDSSISMSQYRQINTIGTEMGITPDQWNMLLNQVTDPGSGAPP